MQTIIFAIASAFSACAPWPVPITAEIAGVQASDAGIGAAWCAAAPAFPEVERFPANGGLTHAEDGVILPDGRLLVGDWTHGLITIAADGTIAPFGDFAAAGFRTKPDSLWNSPNGVSWEPDGRHVLVADITGGHIFRVDTATQAVARIYDHPFGVNAAVRDPSGAIWFTQSTRNAPGAGSEARMFSAADKPMGDGSVWRIAPGEVGRVSPRAVKLVDGLDFANGIVFDGLRGRLYVAEIVASRILSFAVDPATGALGDRRVLARVTTPDNIELAADGMLWAASPFANAIYRVDPDSGAVSTVFNPDPAKSARMVVELERRQAAGEPLLPLLSPELWAPMPGLVTGVILPREGDGPAYVSGLGDALVRIDASTQSGGAAATISPLVDFARDYAKAWSSQNPESVAAFYSETGRLVINGSEPAIGRAAIADVARGFMEAFPDMVVAFDRMGAEAGRQEFQWTLTGTNTGPGGTGARVAISGAEAWLIGSDGLIADSVGAFDAAEYARQLAAPRGEPVPKGDAGTEAARRQIQQTIDTVYAAISGPVGSPRDWDAFRSVFSEDARLFTITAEGLRGGSVEDYIALSDKALVSYGFREAELVNRIEVYGQLAQAWSSYEGHFVRDAEPGSVRGINSFQLQRQADGTWRVHSLLWQQETAEFPLPGSMADNQRQLDAPASAKDPEADREIQTALDNRTRVILEGIRSGDVSGIMALYGPGSLYSSDNATLLSSPEAIKDFWTNVAASPAHDATLEVLRIERLGPDAFVEIQKYAVFDADGARLFGGYASLLWRKVEGRWLIAADVSN